MTHASESGHWYDHQGNPVWEVLGAKGQPVKPDIRHARKLGLLPGVSSINNCAAKDALIRWKVDQGIMAAYTLPAVPGETGEAWKARVIADAEAQTEKAAARGTAIHAAIQGYYLGEQPDPEFWPYVKAVRDVVLKHCGEQKWIPEKSFGHEAGYGGKSDLHCADWLLDFKSKDAGDLDDPAKKLVWDEHPQQLAAYRRGLVIPRAKCANVFVSRGEPILVRFCPHEEVDLERGGLMFEHLLAYWQTKNRYNSAFGRLKEVA